MTDLPDIWAETGRRATKDHQEPQVFRDNQDHRDRQVHQDRLANKEKEVKGEKEEIMDLLVHPEVRVFPDLPDLKEKQDPLGILETRETRDGRVSQGCKEPQGHPDLQEKSVAGGHPAHQDNRVGLDQEVSMVKMVPWDQLEHQACRAREDPWAMTAHQDHRDLLVHPDRQDHKAMLQCIQVPTPSSPRPKDQTHMVTMEDISMTSPSTMKT